MIEASIIIPTRHRAKLLKERLVTIVNNTKELGRTVELIISYDKDDIETINMLASSEHIDQVVECQPQEIPCNKWNLACKHAKGDWLVTLSDDCIPSPKWLTNALNTINQGFLGLPDQNGSRNYYFTPLYMATRSWLKKYHGGVLVIPKYRSWYADIETAERAKRSGTYEVAWMSEVKQLHTVFNTAPNDEIYQIGERRREQDLATFNSRAARYFPDDFESVI